MNARIPNRYDARNCFSANVDQTRDQTWMYTDEICLYTWGSFLSVGLNRLSYVICEMLSSSLLSFSLFHWVFDQQCFWWHRSCFHIPSRPITFPLCVGVWRCECVCVFLSLSLSVSLWLCVKPGVVVCDLRLYLTLQSPQCLLSSQSLFCW